MTVSSTETSSEMQLRLTDLSCIDFRLYDTLDLKDISQLMIFTGPNAVGKTSILEAIQLMTSLDSCRTTHYPQMISWGASNAFIKAHITSSRRDLTLDLSINEKNRQYKLNDKKKSIKDLTGLLPAIVFTPDDLQMIKGAPSLRRKQLDRLGAQISKNYYAVRSDYIKLIKQKNTALKNEMSDRFIDSIDEVLIKVAVQMLQHRMYLTQQVRIPFQEYYTIISGQSEKADIRYRPCWLKDQEGSTSVYHFEKENALCALAEAIQEHRALERVQKRSLVGPHVDEVIFSIDGHDATRFASQGQQRSLVLAYKLAELHTIQSLLSQKPLLLLDDVMSELDEQRRGYFLEFIAEDIQTCITTTNLTYFSTDILNRADVVTLGKHRDEQGDVSRETSSILSMKKGVRNDEIR